MARRLSISRVVVQADRLSDYLTASELYRTAAERVGGHFWLFADEGSANTYVEFREAADPERLADIDAMARSLDAVLADQLLTACISRDVAAPYREVPSATVDRPDRPYQS